MAAQSTLRIGKAGKLGRGVFATKAFAKGELIEAAPLLVIEYPDSFLVSHFTRLGSYVFEHGETSLVLGMGFVSFCNHSYRPNAVYEFDYRQGVIKLIARRKIKRGEQVKINYNCDPDDQTPINFKEWK